jgi:GLTT repeat (6 copies)
MKAKAKRETPKRRGGSDRHGARAVAARKTRRDAADSTARRTRPTPGTTTGREARASKSGPQTSPNARPVERSARPKNSRQARARAKARKAKAPKVVRPRLTERLAIRLASIDLRPHTLLARVPFVVLIIGALGLGLALTLWLSTASAERSYQLSHAREKTRLLQQQKEALERDVREAEAAPALAEAARKQGMIPTRDTAHLVQDASGSWVVVGTPKPADGVPPPPLNTKLADEGAPALPKPAAVAPEVPIRLQPDPGAVLVPGRPGGPEALLRAPDGSTTVGGQHLPPAAPPIPGAPVAPGGPAGGQFPGMLPTPGLPAQGLPTQGLPTQGLPTQGLPAQGLPMPGLPAPAGPAIAPMPAEVPIPVGGLPLSVPAPAPLPAEVPVPVQPGRAPQAAVPVVPGAPGPQGAAALAPTNGAQFVPPGALLPGPAR